MASVMAAAACKHAHLEQNTAETEAEAAVLCSNGSAGGMPLAQVRARARHGHRRCGCLAWVAAAVSAAGRPAGRSAPVLPNCGGGSGVILCTHRPTAVPDEQTYIK